MKIGETAIDDTFAEAFRMRYARLLVTAHDEHWLAAGTREATGYASSIISCDAECGIESAVPPSETPDGRPGARLLFFGFSAEGLQEAVANRVGQCLMTCPTSAIFDGLPQSETRVALGKHVRFFGDGFQRSKVIGDRRYWRVPVMDGEFLCEDTIGIEKGVAGGNLIVQAETLEIALAGARDAVDAVGRVDGCIAPFPGGVVRSGSKVGSRYSALKASTNDAFCPTLRGRVASDLHADARFAYEIVIDGVDESAVERATADAIRAAARPGVVAISAGNYGGSLGKFHFHLREVLR